MANLIPRRDFLKTAAAGLTALGLGAAGGFAADERKKQPNILLIMADEHNRAIAGCYGNKIVQTPNIDSLAAQGITFENHYCNAPLCKPSRSSFTAGKYSSRIDVWSLNSEIASADIPSIPRVMNAAGYESFLCGKQHYDYDRRYGFTEVGGDFNRWFSTGTAKRLGANDLQEKRISGRFDEFHPGNHGSTVAHDRRVTAGAVDFLSRRKASDKPFFLFTGYLAPHFPLIVPEPYYQKYQGKIEMPVIPEGFLDSLPLNYKLLRAGFQEIGVPDATVRRGRELYYGLTNWLDDEIGKVLAALRADPELAENTIIIYTADHGENLGDHGMWWKSAMYEQSAGVPLVITWPKRWQPGQRRTGATSHLDLVQTLADLAGGHTPADWNGSSLLPWLDEQSHPWKDFAVSEYYAHFIASGYVMARTGQWKYTYHTPADKDHPAVRQLHDLSADPHEFTNVAADPAHQEVVKDLHARMVKEVGADPDQTELRARRSLAEGYHRKDRPPAGAKAADQ
jgi:choline-sulfatase